MRLGGLCVCAALLILSSRAQLVATDDGISRLRTDYPVLADVITLAGQRSSAFHRLTEDLTRTDGIVYVTQGHCGHGVRACVPHLITRSGQFRLLRILIEPYDAMHFSDARLAGLIAHELKHALELLSDPRITNTATILRFYEREVPAHGAFETAEAAALGERVSRDMALTPGDHRLASAR